MSKIFVVIFGLFLAVWIGVFLGLMLIHIARAVFKSDTLISFKEFFTLVVWWMPYLACNNDLAINIILKRNKRTKDNK